MTEFKVSLDYDKTVLNFVIRDALRIRRKFDVPLEIYESSQQSYHIRTQDYLPTTMAFKLLDYSRCSSDYKNFCRRMGNFPIRLSEKKIEKDGKLIQVSPPPKKIMTI